MAAQTRYNIAVVGDSGVGKSAYIHRLTTAEFIRPHTSTVGTKVSSYDHLVAREDESIEQGTSFFCNFIDINGDSPYTGSSNDIHAAIIMFDLTSMTSYNNVEAWYNAIREEHPDIPIVLVGNKLDARAAREVRTEDIRFHHIHHEVKYCHLSVKACYQFAKPIDTIARMLA